MIRIWIKFVRGEDEGSEDGSIIFAVAKSLWAS